MLEHPSDRCSCSAQVVRAHLAPPGRTVIDSRHRCEVRRPSILGPMRPIVEFWGSRAWQWPNALAPFLNGDAPSRVAVAYTSGHCINMSQYLTRSTSPRGVPTEFCMLAVRLAVANAAPCDKDASGEVARSRIGEDAFEWVGDRNKTPHSLPDVTSSNTRYTCEAFPEN